MINRFGIEKVRNGKRIRVYYPVDFQEKGKVIECRFRYNPDLVKEIKTFSGASWHAEKRYWTISNNFRNRFQLKFVSGGNPYAHYDKPLIEYSSKRDLYQHQIEMVQLILTRHFCILAASPGLGKTLSAIEAMEYVQSNSQEKVDVLWVGPRSALAAAELEFYKWDCRIQPTFTTYDSLHKLISKWPKGRKAPRIVIFDESSKIKNAQTKRSKAAMHIAESIRADWGVDGYIVLMSGTPAPKCPVDWHNQCETAQPGFLKEGNPNKFRDRLAVIETKQSITGMSFPSLVTWRDDDLKCQICGMYPDHSNHDSMGAVLNDFAKVHKYVRGSNEVAKLYRRMNGLVGVWDKRTCLDLPDKIYRLIKVEPNQETLNAARIITARAASGVIGAYLLRELSDGFQYTEIEIGEKRCDLCNGRGSTIVPIPRVSQEVIDDYLASGGDSDEMYEDQEVSCSNCGGGGSVPNMQREAIQIPSPKEDVVNGLLEEYEDIGRIVFYAGFTGSVDRLTQIISKKDWKIIRVDGRGWTSFGMKGVTRPVRLLQEFQNPKRSEYDKIAYVSQASSGGMGLTLTASPVIIYYSNDFNGESRMQSEERIHRIGMDQQRGATIIDIIHLPTDLKILDALKKRRRLQSMSLGEFQDVLNDSEYLTRV